MTSRCSQLVYILIYSIQRTFGTEYLLFIEREFGTEHLFQTVLRRHRTINCCSSYTMLPVFVFRIVHVNVLNLYSSLEHPFGNSFHDLPAPKCYCTHRRTTAEIWNTFPAHCAPSRDYMNLIVLIHFEILTIIYNLLLSMH